MHLCFHFIALLTKNNMGWRDSMDLLQSSWKWLKVQYCQVLIVQVALTTLLNLSIASGWQNLTLNDVIIHHETRWGGGWPGISWSAPICHKDIEGWLWKSSFVYENSSIMGGKKIYFLFLLMLTVLHMAFSTYFLRRHPNMYGFMFKR